MMYCVDVPLKWWLGQNKTAKDHLDVNNNLMNFDVIVDQALGQQFGAPPPSTFQFLEDGKPAEIQSIYQQDPISRKRSYSNAEVNCVTNNDQLEEFKMKTGEDWTKNSKGTW